MDPNACPPGTDWNAIFTGLTTLVGALTGSAITFMKMAPDWRLGRSIRPGPMRRRKRGRVELEGSEDESTKP